MKKYYDLRNEYKNFYYNGYSIDESDAFIDISFDFSIDTFVRFNPKLSIDKKNFKILNSVNNITSQKIVFYMGMVELISYWKCVCPKNVIIKADYLSPDEILWWKKLYFYGLGEFFYVNGIKPDIENFMNIVCEAHEKPYHQEPFNICDDFKNIIPVGGGKDSSVSLELLSSFKNIPLIINARNASLYSAYKASYNRDDILEISRVIDPNLLELNKKGFLNGHTPFSAMLGFTSLFCSYILGITNIALSNESSANESNIKGTNINHQYSKSFEFELDFSRYIKKYICDKINYFSLLRPFSEIKIAEIFSRYPKYYDVFKSCNVGSKKDIWCGKCPKCLFVYIILLPFIDISDMIKIFNKDMLDDIGLLKIFRGLVGLDDVKPFECVGTIEEVNFSLNLAYEKHYKNSKLPKLLDYYMKNYTGNRYLDSTALTDFNENNIPEELLSIVGDAK